MSGTVCRGIVLAVLAVPMSFGVAQAGRNAGGALVVHTNDNVSYGGRFPHDYWCHLSVPSTCEELNTRSDRYDPLPALVWFLWAFPADAHPEVRALRLGVVTDFTDYYVDFWWVCGPGAVEDPTPEWPMGGGDVITFDTPVYDKLFKFYWFVVFGWGPGVFFGTGPDPRVGFASFTDNSNHPVEDRCDLFGQVRWGEPGWNECPQWPTGACCFGEDCEVTTEAYCAQHGGRYIGDGVPCEPQNPCIPVPIRQATWGQVKAGYRWGRAERSAR